MYIALLQKEWQEEMETTRKILEVVPEDFEYTAHTKSMKLWRLATHVAELASWVHVTINEDGIDFAIPNKPNKPQNHSELMELFEKFATQSIAVLKTATEEKLSQNWTMKNGEIIYFTMPKAEVLRKFVFSHIIHHRAQLGLNLRLLNISLPQSYGPTADFK
jgi:uncharacterized damage-inducible protein DinB